MGLLQNKKNKPGRVHSMHHNHADTDNDAKYEANIKTLHRNFMVRKTHPTVWVLVLFILQEALMFSKYQKIEVAPKSRTIVSEFKVY
jgi:hypothetical protein